MRDQLLHSRLLDPLLCVLRQSCRPSVWYAVQALPSDGGSSVRSSSSEVQSLEAKVDQLQSRLAYMEDEKTRLITAAKNKNEQVQQPMHILPQISS